MYVHKSFWNLFYVIKYKIFVTPGSPGGWVLEPPGDPGAGNFFCWNPRRVRGRGIFLSTAARLPGAKMRSIYYIHNPKMTVF